MTTSVKAQTTRRTSVDDRPWPCLVWSAVAPSAGSCCCPGKPAFQAVLPPSQTVTAPIEILLCNHHYRRSRTELRRMGGAIYDSAGRAVALPA